MVTRNEAFSAEGAERAASLSEALEMAAQGPGETFVIGGGEIYAQALSEARRLYLTMIDAPSPVDAAVYFPAIDAAQWQMTEASEATVDPASGLSYRFVTLERV